MNGCQYQGCGDAAVGRRTVRDVGILAEVGLCPAHAEWVERNGGFGLIHDEGGQTRIVVPPAPRESASQMARPVSPFAEVRR
jgi:hypothetical protein